MQPACGGGVSALAVECRRCGVRGRARPHRRPKTYRRAARPLNCWTAPTLPQVQPQGASKHSAPKGDGVRCRGGGPGAQLVRASSQGMLRRIQIVQQCSVAHQQQVQMLTSSSLQDGQVNRGSAATGRCSAAAAAPPTTAGAGCCPQGRSAAMPAPVLRGWEAAAAVQAALECRADASWAGGVRGCAGNHVCGLLEVANWLQSWWSIKLVSSQNGALTALAPPCKLLCGSPAPLLFLPALPGRWDCPLPHHISPLQALQLKRHGWGVWRGASLPAAAPQHSRDDWPPWESRPARKERCAAARSGGGGGLGTVPALVGRCHRTSMAPGWQ